MPAVASDPCTTKLPVLEGTKIKAKLLVIHCMNVLQMRVR